MPLPHWTADGVLPPGAHPADLADIYERLVCDAPYQNEREILFGALSSYLGVVCRIIPSGRAWIDGGLALWSEEPPGTVDVVLIPDEWGSLKKLDGAARAALYGMVTLRGAIIGQPAMYLDQVQPVHGLLDGYLCVPGHEEVWAQTWSSVRGPYGPVEGLVKGYAEVRW
ncbi:DUF6932 family protein [Amycolatopsis albispora]|uniref:Uncharacterized protein n=1 Tax=Amycolatopsis albispora TaxID=1804986 RepID=A0A344LBY8_9PSEU|nr:hypothetical protein [Amycolatopsis albispora]AXB45562.1 hypothetical protein A4R43_26255 [Amycolatopsis albispora]